MKKSKMNQRRVMRSGAAVLTCLFVCLAAKEVQAIPTFVWPFSSVILPITAADCLSPPALSSFPCRKAQSHLLPPNDAASAFQIRGWGAGFQPHHIFGRLLSQSPAHSKPLTKVRFSEWSKRRPK